MREKIALKTSVISVVSKLITMAMAMILTRLIVRYLGIEIRGIHAVLANFLGFLQLTELGIGIAVTYALYQPLADGNTSEVSALMHLYRTMYRWIFLAIIVIGTLVSPLLKAFITDSAYSFSYIYVAYFIQVISAAATYLMAYNRNIFYADQRQYVTIFIDFIAYSIGFVFQVFCLIQYKSYLALLLCAGIQTILANIVITYKAGVDYPYLKLDEMRVYSKKNELFSNLKDIVASKIGGWVYSSTDNLLLSRFAGVVVTGKMSNYYTLSSAIGIVTSAIVAPIQPMIAGYIRDNKTKEDSYRLFLNYTFVRYCIANVVCVGMAVMMDSVVSIWVGGEYTMPLAIALLITTDIFISIVHGPAGEFVIGLGLFHSDRNMSIGGAVINIVFSLLLVNAIGASGVLMGTVIAQLYYWFVRAYIVYKDYFKISPFQYIFKVLKYIFEVIIDVVVLKMAFGKLFSGEVSLMILIIEILLCIITSLLTIVVFNFASDEYKFMCAMIKRNVQRK